MAFNSSALLIPSSGLEVVYDDDNELYWYLDLSAFINKTYGEQVDAIAALNTGGGYYGFTDWHMANHTEIEGLFTTYSFGDITSAFDPTWSPDGDWYTGRYDLSVPVDAHYTAEILLNPDDTLFLSTLLGSTADTTTEPFIGAWVVSNGSSVPVPEPSTMLILGFGLVGIASVRRKMKI